MDTYDLIFLGWEIERADDGQRQAHDRLIELYERLFHAGAEIPEALEKYHRAYPDGNRSGLRKVGDLEPWKERAVAMVMFASVPLPDGTTLTQEKMAEQLGVPLDSLKSFLKTYRKRKHTHLN